MTQYSAFQVTTGNNTSGPGASIAFSAGIVMGLGFEATSAAQFLYGYYCWRSDSSQSASASFALWTVTSATTGTEQGASARASISGMATGQWNFIALATPFALTQNQTYKIVVGITGNFNDTHNQFGNAGAPYLGGIVNGPLNVYSGPVAFSGTNQMPFANTYQGSFLTGGGGGSGAADPTANYPISDDSCFNPWIDLLIGPAAAAGGANAAPLVVPSLAAIQAAAW